MRICGTTKGPAEWWCTRERGHDGPCADVPISIGWIGVDFDKTLARHESGESLDRGGAPVPQMVARVQAWLSNGRQVRIVTARVSPEWDDVEHQRTVIEDWCEEHIGHKLPVQCHKDGGLVELWDDRAIGVVPNVGMPVTELAFALDRAMAMQRVENVLSEHGYLRREVEGETKNEQLIAALVDAVLRRPS
jgi:hypothetical protein